MAKRNSAPTPPAPDVSAISERLDWHHKIGWRIAVAYAVVFGGLLTWYLPKELESTRNAAKSDVEAALGPIRSDLAVLKDRVPKAIGMSLNSLIPSPNVAKTIQPATLKAWWHETRSIASAAFDQRVPGDFRLITSAAERLRETVQQPQLTDEVRASGTAALVSLEAYALFSAVAITVSAPRVIISKDGTTYAPVTVSSPVWLQGMGPTGAALTVDFTSTHPPYPHYAAFVVDRTQALLSGLRLSATDKRTALLALVGTGSAALVAETSAQHVTQSLDGVVWTDVEFSNSTIRYDGRPTHLRNVRFTNCRFEFSRDRVSQWLLSKLLASKGEPVTLASDVRL